MEYYKTIQVDKKQVRLHRYLIEQHYGIKLNRNELVHHINGDMLDNRIENLEIITRSEHKKKHPEIGRNTRFKNKYKFIKSEIMSLYETHTIQQIADYYNCYPMTIWSFMKKNNIKTKKRGRHES